MITLCRFREPAILLLAFAACSLGAVDFDQEFQKEIRPILESSCLDCHGAEKQKGGLRLDRKGDALKGGESGEPAIAPGRSAASALFARITSKDSDEAMPPKGDRLKPEQIALIQRWIDNGAHWPTSGQPRAEAPVASTASVGKAITDQDRTFWSFVPPKRSQPALPSPSAWPRQPIDGFILARLIQNGLTPSAEASPRELIRRMTYDLTGLPPTPEEIEAFLSDREPGAVERLADRLLASPRFGERMASLWLPLARYGEDQAHQVGNDTKFFYPNAYHYRAWVIDAFNRDLPYDRFLKLQLAADLLPDAGPRELPALGFLGLGPKYYNRGRLDVMADEWEDRVDTMCRTMLGLTVACARCHDHKFDPISMRDYYALAGVFASTAMVNKTAAGQRASDKVKAEEMSADVLHIVEDAPPQNLNVFLRGNVDNKGPVTPRRFIEVLSAKSPPSFAQGSGRRELAECIASAQNPLAARVFVNRMWALFFRRPLVSTPSNFGHSGDLPTHPELLDDLARRFMDGGWSMKTLARELVLSATYRQSSVADADRLRRDPANRWLSRMNRLRLSFEQWRDAVLADSGQLFESVGARSVRLDNPANSYRTVYSYISRLKLADQLIRFDYPDANVPAEQRASTTTPLQKLFLLNSPFILHQAKALAARLQAGAEDDATRVINAYVLLFGREPDEAEQALAAAFLLRPSSSPDITRWEQYAQVLLISNEMLYVD